MTKQEFYKKVTDSVQETRRKIREASADVRDLEASRKNYTAEYVNGTLNPKIKALQKPHNDGGDQNHRKGP